VITTNSVGISAPAEVVWAVFSDVERWPTWTRSVTSVEPLDGAALEPGRRFRIRQPRLPVLVWRVSDVDPGRSWTWRATAPGATTDAWHRLRPDGDAATVVTQGIDQRGPLGVLVGVLMRRLTRQYLALEAQGLKRATEDRAVGRTGLSPGDEERA
jgi:uncharacterized membrane protein